MFHVLPEQVIIISFLGLLAWAACSDAVEFEIPNTASLGLAFLYPLFVHVSSLPIEWLWALVVAGAVFAVSFFLFITGRFGGGDVKLLTVAALWAGPKLILPMLIIMSLTGGLLAFVVWSARQIRRYHVASYGDVSLTSTEYAVSTRLPYGVAIAVGAGLVGLQLVSG
jgi:prepilin peptidase CpaA